MSADDLKPCDLATLATFEFDRVLSESPTTGSAYLLGTLHGEPAIVHVQRTAIDAAAAPGIVKNGLEALDVFLDNRPYFSAQALIARTPGAYDLALKLVWPCTDTHIRKYTAQPRRLLRETPETYRSVVEPYISSFPADRLAWVYAILDGVKEAERVLYRSPREDADGFVLLPDLKWDGTTLSALYLSAIVNNSAIRSLRDLDRRHLPLLRKIRRQAYATAADKYAVEPGKLRMFIHYQPSYYHFHVHVVHVQHEILAGMAVGQAHLLDDVIDWLELSPPDAPSLPARMTFTYALGVEHGLYAGLLAAQDTEPDAVADADADASAAATAGSGKRRRSDSDAQ